MGLEPWIVVKLCAYCGFVSQAELIFYVHKVQFTIFRRVINVKLTIAPADDGTR
jgi:hypothetical protein